MGRMFHTTPVKPAKAVVYGANFGRDADTIATMAGAVAGAFAGASALPRAWLDKLPPEQEKLARDLAEAARKKAEEAEAALSAFRGLF